MAEQAGRERTLIIIGAGIAGLSAGVYARMNGYRTRLLELGSQPGGVCTSWRRDGYTIDGCIHWLLGSAPGSSLHRMWRELGALQGRSFVYPDEFSRIEGLDGRCFTAPTDLERFQAHLLELAAPEDQGLVRRLVRTARALGRSDLPLDAPEAQGLAARLQGLTGTLSLMMHAREWLGLSVGQLASRFRSPLLREALTRMWEPEMSAVFLLYNLGFIGRRQAGYPLGGSLAFSRAIESRYLSLGGRGPLWGPRHAHPRRGGGARWGCGSRMARSTGPTPCSPRPMGIPRSSSCSRAST